eukprot:TRINITY_DN25478_c0_g1_i1.p1 TRINITY_DN25478_c0_g1~~TRINITY_DN25478_c0_g1_i1.p1  ORF type:complete len:326 (+),score=107.43 TRINITY_DN25478_c0_g1_i1:264-1241(+)
MQFQGMPLRQRDVNVPLGGRKRGGALRIPATAVVNDATGEWEETDTHRLAQRRKQLYFGMVTEGYKNYVRRVRKEDRQEGNEWHPMTPRLNQVCSKRSWDCQVGRWRRSLHYWDSDPSPEEMRKDPEELKQNIEQLAAIQPRLIATAANAIQQPTVKVKYTINGDDFKLLITPLKTSYATFTSALKDKNGTIRNMHYCDPEGDIIDVDDDVSLRTFLDSVATCSPSPKLCVDLISHTPQEISKALRLLRAKVPAEHLTKISERFSLDVSAAAHQPVSCTPVTKPIPALVDLVTPTPDGETPAMNVYYAMWTPEPECKERKKLNFE